MEHIYHETNLLKMVKGHENKNG